jgi:hypothetical protein
MAWTTTRRRRHTHQVRGRQPFSFQQGPGAGAAQDTSQPFWTWTRSSLRRACVRRRRRCQDSRAHAAGFEECGRCAGGGALVCAHSQLSASAGSASPGGRYRGRRSHRSDCESCEASLGRGARAHAGGSAMRAGRGSAAPAAALALLAAHEAAQEAPSGAAGASQAAAGAAAPRKEETCGECGVLGHRCETRTSAPAVQGLLQLPPSPPPPPPAPQTAGLPPRPLPPPQQAAALHAAAVAARRGGCRSLRLGRCASGGDGGGSGIDALNVLPPGAPPWAHAALPAKGARAIHCRELRGRAARRRRQSPCQLCAVRACVREAAA